MLPALVRTLCVLDSRAHRAAAWVRGVPARGDTRDPRERMSEPAGPCWAYLVVDELLCAMRTSFLTLFTPSTDRMSSSASFASVGVLATPVKVTFP
jgi:hypothetical protein